MHVTITRTLGVCTLRPWIKGLGDELTFVRVDHRHGYIPKGERKVDFTPVRLYDVPAENPTQGVFPSGLYDRVVEWLDNAGHCYQVVDKRNVEKLKPMPDFTKVGKLREGQGEALVKMASADLGIIVAATAFGKSFVITQACRMYPTLRFLIVTPRVSVVNSLYERLQEAVGKDQVGRAGGGKNILGRRVMVATTKSMKKVYPEQVDILFFDEVHGVGDNEVSITLANYVHCRRFGFTASPVRGDNSEMCMEAVFGRFLMEVSYQEAVAMGNVVQIEVDMMPVTGFSVRTYDSSYANKRHSYWRNTERNKIIAREAQEVPADEQCLIFVETLEHAVYLKQHLPDYKIVHFGKSKLEYHAYEWVELQPTDIHGQNGWVLVDDWTWRKSTPEDPIEEKRYAWRPTSQTDKEFQEAAAAAGREVQLLGRVHGPDYLYGRESTEEQEAIEPVNTEGVKPGSYYLVRQEEYILDVPKSSLDMTPAEKEEIRKEFESGTLKKVIATTTWKEGVDFEQLQHLIRADGGSSEVNNTQMPGRLSRLFEGKEKGTMTDFRDDFNPWAARRTTQRLAVYRKHGWKINN